VDDSLGPNASVYDAIATIGALRKYGLKREVANSCIGGGEATAMALELS
jgi:hypothetical protein